MAKKSSGAVIPPPLPGMPEGDVPQDIRETAEYVVKLQQDIDHMREDCKRELEKLMDKMVRAEIQVVPVIIDQKWKKRILIKKGGVTLKIEDDGMIQEKMDITVSTESES